MRVTLFLLAVAVAAVIVSFTTLRFFDSPVQRFAIDAGIYVIYVLGGVLLAGVPFDRKHTRSGWARTVFGLVALVLVFIGATELLRHYRLWVLSSQAEHGFSHTLTLLRGVVVGFLLALLFSGELAGRKVSSHANA